MIRSQKSNPFGDHPCRLSISYSWTMPLILFIPDVLSRQSFRHCLSFLTLPFVMLGKCDMDSHAVWQIEAHWEGTEIPSISRPFMIRMINAARTYMEHLHDPKLLFTWFHSKEEGISFLKAKTRFELSERDGKNDQHVRFPFHRSDCVVASGICDHVKRCHRPSRYRHSRGVNHRFRPPGNWRRHVPI